MTRIPLLMLIIGLLAAPTNGSNVGVSVPEREVPWWETTGMDLDRNGIHDAIDRSDERWFDIFVDYDHTPTQADVDRLEDLGVRVSAVLRIVDAVSLHGVPRDTIPAIRDLPGVVLVEEQAWLVGYIDTATPGVKARGSDEYSPQTAWDKGYTGNGINIAILDTGVDDQHESLDGKFVAGVDFSYPGLVINTNPDDGNGHGTHCAGIAMGNGGQTDSDSDGEPDYMGAAPDARLIDVKISTDLGFSASTLAQGIEWCVEHRDDDWGDSDPTNDGIQVLSISFGSPGSSSSGDDVSSRAVNNATANGLIVVCAAGNDGNDFQGFSGPGAADTAITVGAVDNLETIIRGDDIIGDYSNSGPRDDDGDDDQMDELKPEVVAPGSNISSAQYSPIGQVGIGYVNNTGTSMACPMVSGIVACLLEAEPDLDWQDVEAILIATAEAHGDPYDEGLSDKYNRLWGFGYVDAYLAVMMALGGNGGVVDETVTCSITSPVQNADVSGVINITGFTTIEEGAVDEVAVIWDNGTEIIAAMADGSYEGWYLTFDTSTLEPGPHNITAIARAGIRESEPDTVHVKVVASGGGGGGDDDDDDGLLPFPWQVGLMALPAALFLFRRKRA